MLQLTVVPRVNPPEGEGRLGIGVRSMFALAEGTRFANAGFKNEKISLSVPDAFSYSLRNHRRDLQAHRFDPGPAA